MAKSWYEKYATYEEAVTGTATGITAYATGGQANAVNLTSKYNSVDTCATALDSVKLVAMLIGKTQYVFNNTANVLAVYPQSGEYINGALNMVYWVQPSACVKFESNASGKCFATLQQPYKKWMGLVSQAGTSAPTATVIENTLGGTITFARTSAGVYTATLTGVFTASKTMVFITNGNNTANAAVSGYRSSADVITFRSAGGSDDIYSSASFEIRVYP